MACATCSHTADPILMDESMGIKVCLRCGMTYNADMDPLINISPSTIPADERPPIHAEKTSIKDIVCDLAFDEEGQMVLSSRVYLPKEDLPITDLDVNDPKFKFAMKVHRKRFKNRRRYMYERQRKTVEKGTV